MTMPSTLIAARVQALPITRTERREALAYISTGEAIAGVLIRFANWLEASPSLKPSYQD